MSMNLDEDGALFDCCEPAKPVMPSFSSTVRLQPTQDQDGVEQLDINMLAPDSAPVPANVTASASLSRSDCPLSPVASPIPSPLASPPCLSPPVAASPPLSPSPQRTSTLLAAAPYLSPLPSPEPTPAHSHTTPPLPLRLSPSPAITSNAPALIEPSPTPPPPSAFCQTRKRGNAGPPCPEPQPKKSKVAGSTKSNAPSTNKSPPTASLSSKRGRPRKGAMAGPVADVTTTRSESRSPTDVPEWFAKSLQMLQSSGNTLGRGWEKLVQLWVEFEQKEGFEESGKLGTAGRPDCIFQWKKRARSSTWRPDISNVSTFEREFRAWWISLQPTWRVSEGKIVSGGKGDWDVLRKPGLNGLICMLVGLFYWGTFVQTDKSQHRGWVELVEDCTLVLRQLAG